MRTISIVVLVITASALALTQVKTKDAKQKTQVARETTSMRKQAKAMFDKGTENQVRIGGKTPRGQ